MASTSSTSDPACEEINFERSFAELEAIVHELEDGQLGLAEALSRYEQGIKHLQHCYKLLQAAEQKIELLTGIAGDGSPITEPFEESGESLAESAGRRRRGRKPATSAGDDAQDDIGASADAT